MRGVPFERLVVREVALPLRTPFRGAVTETTRIHLIIELVGDQISGWGESPLLSEPYYLPETPATARHIIESFCVPLLKAARPTTPHEVGATLGVIAGNQVARAGIECAAWDLWARAHRRSLFEVVGSVRPRVEVGISLGVGEELEATLGEVSSAVERGYRRVKLKIRPPWDLGVVSEVRRAFPALRLWVDGNGQYREDDLPRLRKLSEYGVELIEQPFMTGDYRLHRKLRAQCELRVSLDENITSSHDVDTTALTEGADSVAIKFARLGGVGEALAAIARAQRNGLTPWIGGLLESGIGRALNLILAGRPECTLPGDIAESARYAERDLITTPFVLEPAGELTVPQGPGLGVEVDTDYLDSITVSRLEFELR